MSHADDEPAWIIDLVMKVRANPDGLVVMRVTKPLSPEARLRLKERMASLFQEYGIGPDGDGADVLVLDDGARLELLSDKELRAAGLMRIAG